jgi:hypothetical protein
MIEQTTVDPNAMRWEDDGGHTPPTPLRFPSTVAMAPAGEIAAHDFVDPRPEILTVRVALTIDDYCEFLGMVRTLRERRKLDSIGDVVMNALRRAIVSEVHL